MKNGEMKNDARVVPFLFLNVESKAVMEKGNCFNKEEEKVIIQLVKSIKEIHGKTPNMGIITFYAKQKQNISLELQVRYNRFRFANCQLTFPIFLESEA